MDLNKEVLLGYSDMLPSSRPSCYSTCKYLSSLYISCILPYVFSFMIFRRFFSSVDFLNGLTDLIVGIFCCSFSVIVV